MKMPKPSSLEELFLNEINIFKDFSYFSSFYLNKIVNIGNNNREASGFIVGETLVDVNTIYKTNSYGYRDSEIQRTDIVFSGCSFTFGIGVQEKHRWSNFIINKTQKTGTNLGIPGGSTITNILNFFAYCKEFGNPESALFLFPNFERLTFPGTFSFLNNELYSKTTKPILALQTFDLSHKYQRNLGDLDKPKELKSPYSFEDVISLDIAYWINLNLINILESYCLSNNIKLFWSAWDEHAVKLIRNIKLVDNNAFLYYVESDVESWKYKKHINTTIYSNANCHIEIEKQIGDSFHRGLDVERGTGIHPGVHQHIHFANTFLKNMNLEII